MTEIVLDSGSWIRRSGRWLVHWLEKIGPFVFFPMFIGFVLMGFGIASKLIVIILSIVWLFVVYGYHLIPDFFVV